MINGYNRAPYVPNRVIDWDLRSHLDPDETPPETANVVLPPPPLDTGGVEDDGKWRTRAAVNPANVDS